jgi:protocatechuate 3,4-dioxygenase beta subunit
MKRLSALVLTLISASFLMADPGAITGTVVDRSTGNPIAQASVVARGDNGHGATRTDDRGNYEIVRLPPGSYRVAAEAAGFSRSSYPEPVVVRSGQTVPGIVVRLVPEPGARRGAIAGRVTDRKTGEPIPKALVIAQGRAGKFRTGTDRHGEYLLLGLEPGDYRVTAKARHHIGQDYPEAVAVRAGEVTRGINVALAPRPRKGAIVGQVTDARTGEPIRGVLVIARGEGARYRGLTDGRGVYRLGGVKPGRYQVGALKRGYLPERFPGLVPVHPGEATRGIDIRLHRANLKDS